MHYAGHKDDEPSHITLFELLIDFMASAGTLMPSFSPLKDKPRPGHRLDHFYEYVDQSNMEQFPKLTYRYLLDKFTQVLTVLCKVQHREMLPGLCAFVSFRRNYDFPLFHAKRNVKKFKGILIRPKLLSPGATKAHLLAIEALIQGEDINQPILQGQGFYPNTLKLPKPEFPDDRTPWRNGNRLAFREKQRKKDNPSYDKTCDPPLFSLLN